MTAEGSAWSSTQRLRSLVAVIASAGCIGTTFGLTHPLLALRLEQAGETSGMIGLNAAASAIAVLACGPFVPRLLDGLGVLRALYLATAACAAIILLLPLWQGLGPWFLLRFLLGAFGAVHWIVSETWIISVASDKGRGRIVATYMMVMAGGFACGPLLVTLVGIDGFTPFLIAAALTAVSALPLAFARDAVPRLPPRAKASFVFAFRAAPLLMMAAMLAGFTDMAVIALLPIYGMDLGLPRDGAVQLLTIILIGTMALQLPIGWLADRFDTRRLLVACGVIFLVSPLLLPPVIGEPLYLWPLLIIWGGASIGIYTLALISIGGRFGAAELAGANAAMVALYETGSIFGPLAAGAGLDALGPPGFPLVLVAAAALFLVLALFRGWQRRGGS